MLRPSRWMSATDSEEPRRGEEIMVYKWLQMLLLWLFNNRIIVTHRRRFPA